MKTSKEDILLTSLRLFAERGFDAVSTSMIAAEFGITKGALYRHYESKQDIFDQIIKKMFELLNSRLMIIMFRQVSIKMIKRHIIILYSTIYVSL